MFKILSRLIQRGHAGLRALLCVAILMGVHGAASAFVCTMNLTLSPAFPTTISTSYSAGTVVWSGTATGVFSCAAAATGGDALFFTVGSTASSLYGMTGLNAVLNGSASYSGVSGCPVSGITTQSTRLWLSYTSQNGTPCKMTLTIPFKIIATGAAISGTWPNANCTASASAGTCNLVPASQGGTAFAYFSNAAAGATYTYTTNYVQPTIAAYTCSVSASTVSVALPKVATSALSSSGKTAMRTPFVLSYTGCTANGGSGGTGFTGTATWAYTPVGSNSYISNTASSAASNVYAQLLDSSMNPIANGGTTTFSVPQAGGAVSKTYYAQYISAGTPGAGNVLGVATYTMSYN